MIIDNVTNEEIVLATMEVIGTIWNLIDLIDTNPGIESIGFEINDMAFSVVLVNILIIPYLATINVLPTSILLIGLILVI